jgi:hypothetical protein
MLEPLAAFMSNPAGAAVINSVGPIRQVVAADAAESRRYLVIAPHPFEVFDLKVLLVYRSSQRRSTTAVQASEDVVPAGQRAAISRPHLSKTLGSRSSVGQTRPASAHRES